MLLCLALQMGLLWFALHLRLYNRMFKLTDDSGPCVACKACPPGFQRVGCGGAREGVCRGLPCPNPPVVEHAMHTATNGMRYPSNATYTCTAGYALANETARTLVCEPDLLWSGVMPQCIGVPCPNLTLPQFGSILPLNVSTFRFPDNASECLCLCLCLCL